MKTQTYLAVLTFLCHVSVVLAKCVHEDEYIAGVHWAHTMFLRYNEQILQSLPTRWLRIVVSEMENDLNTEKRILAQLGNIPEPIGEDMKLDPSFMKELDFLSGVIIGFDVNNNIIEDFLDPSTHFLKNCFGGNSFDLIDDPVYLNSVVNDVLDCAVIGVDLLMDLVDIAPVRDTDLRSELIRRMQLMGEIAYEIQALTELLNELKRNVEDDCIDQ